MRKRVVRGLPRGRDRRAPVNGNGGGLCCLPLCQKEGEEGKMDCEEILGHWS